MRRQAQAAAILESTGQSNEAKTRAETGCLAITEARQTMLPKKTPRANM